MNPVLSTRISALGKSFMELAEATSIDLNPKYMVPSVCKM